MNARYDRGVAIAEQLSGRRFADLTGEVAELAPDFVRLTIEFAFGDLYSRPAASLRTREIAAVAALAALGTALPQLRVHVSGALNAGVSKVELIEILMQTAIYAGFPAALGALSGCHDLLCSDAAPDRE